MANSMDMHLNIHNSLNRDLGKSLKSMDSFNDKLSKSDFVSGSITKKWVGTNDILAKTKRNMSGVLDVAKRLVPAIGVIFGGGIIVQSTRDVIQYSQSFRELSHQMGDGVKSTGEYSKAMADASLATGLAVEDIGDLAVGLRSLRVPLQNLEEASILTARFSEVTGVSADQTARLYGEMIRTGRMSTEMASNTLASLALIQKEFGLTSSELDSLSYGIVSITQRMNQLGKTSQQASNMTKGTVALAIAFSKVGIEADKAIDIIDDLLNPERVEENAFLYAKLGISIGDAFEGNIDIVGQMIPRMTELGKQMQNMSGPAAAAMAKSLGLPLNTLRQFGEINLGFEEQRELARLMSEEGLNAGEALAAMQSETRGLDKIFSAIANTMQTVVSKAAEILGRHFAGFGDSLREFDKSDTFVNISNVMEKTAGKLVEFVNGMGGIEGVIEKITSGFSKFIGFIAKAPKLIPLIGVGLFIVLNNVRKRLYSATTGAVKDMTEELKVAVEGVYDMMKSRSSTIASEGFSSRKEIDKPGIFSVEAIERRNKARMQENRLQQVFSERQAEIANDQKVSLEDEMELISTRLDHLAILEKRRKLTFREADEQRRLTNIQLENQREFVKLEAESTRIQNKAIADRRREIKYSSNEALSALFKEISYRQEYNNNSLEETKKQIEEDQKRLNLNEQITSMLKVEYARAQEEGRGEDLARIADKMKQIEIINTQLSNSLDEQTIKHIELTDLNEKYKKQAEEINAVYQKRTGMDLSAGAPEEIRVHGIFSRMMETAGQAFRGVQNGLSKAVSGVKDSFHFIVNSAGNTIKNFVEDLKNNTARTLFNAGKKVISAPLKGIGDMFKTNIGRLIGPMAIMGLGMKLLQPVIEELQPTIDILTNTFKNVFMKILQAIAPSILRVLSSLMPLLASLVNVALPPLVMALGGIMQLLGSVVNALGTLIKVLGFFSDDAKKFGDSVKDIGAELKDGGINAFNEGIKMMSKENKVISNETVTEIQKGLTDVANRFANGDIVLTTKEETKDKFAGAGISLDKNGNIKINYNKPKKEDFEKINIDFKVDNTGNVLKNTEDLLKKVKTDFERDSGISKEVLNNIPKAYPFINNMNKTPILSNMRDGIIFKDNNIVHTDPNDNIIASKSTPKVVNNSESYRSNAEVIASNLAVVKMLDQIKENLDGVLINGRKSVENLEVIKNSSQKTASQTKGSVSPAFNIT